MKGTSLTKQKVNKIAATAKRINSSPDAALEAAIMIEEINGKRSAPAKRKKKTSLGATPKKRKTTTKAKKSGKKKSTPKKAKSLFDRVFK